MSDNPIVRWLEQHTDGAECAVEFGAGRFDYCEKMKSERKVGVEVFRDYLLIAARTTDSSLSAFVSGIRLYREQRPALYFELYKWVAARAAPEVDIERLWRAMVTADLSRRNRAWMPRLVAEMDRGNVFVVVGAGHLPYRFGLVELLREKGFRVTRVQ